MGYRLNCRDIAVACSGASVEYGWAIGLAVMIPHMLASPLSLSPAVAGAVWLVNPIFGFFIGPALGKISDRTGRRKKWITILGLLAILSHIILIISPSVRLPRAAEITICFLVFGLMDLSHDLLLIPGRALLVDQFTLRGCDVMGKKDGGVADTMYTTMQIFGRLGGLFAGTFPIENVLPFEASHFQATLATSVVVLLVTNSLAVTYGKERDEYTVNEDVSLQNHSEPEPPLAAGDGEQRARSISILNQPRSDAFALVMVLMIQFIGWIGSMTYFFWCTTWLGLQTSLAGTSLSFPMAMMFIQTLVALIFSFFLPKLNRIFPTAWVWLLIELLNLGSICSARWLGLNNPIATFVILAISGGPYYIVHFTNAQLLCRIMISDEDKIGWVAGLLNNTMTAAQVLVGGLSGLIVVCNKQANDSTQACPEIGEVLYFWVGLIGFIIDLFILALDVIYFEGRIFSFKSEKKRREYLQMSHSQMSFSPKQQFNIKYLIND